LKRRKIKSKRVYQKKRKKNCIREREVIREVKMLMIYSNCKILKLRIFILWSSRI